MAQLCFRFKVVLTNAKALRALATACDNVAEAAEERPWDSELQAALKALRYAVKHLELAESGTEE